MIINKKNTSIILMIGIIFVVGYKNKDEIVSFIESKTNYFIPCSKPIKYSIGSFDERFGITKEQFLNDIKKAENIWEKPIEKDLFEYDQNSDIKINLIYDYRQQSTDILKKLGIVIDNNKSSYNTLKDKYDSEEVLYNQKKIYLESLINDYNIQKKSYEEEVNYWNKHGGVSDVKYNELKNKENELNNSIDVIQKEQQSLNKLVDTINSLANVLNKIVTDLNLSVKKFNFVGSSVPKEFNEGEYFADINSKSINIYQFDNENKLIRVLAHEFGHALKIEHIDNPKAIMYRLNQDTNEKLTTDDINALKKVCNIK